MENLIYRWMMTRATPMAMESPMFHLHQRVIVQRTALQAWCDHEFS